MKRLEKENRFEHIGDAIKNENVHVFTRNGRATVGNTSFRFFPYGEMQTGNLQLMWKMIFSLLIFEEKFRHILRQNMTFPFSPAGAFAYLVIYTLIIVTVTNCYYPGSPLNTTFDRDENQYGLSMM